MDKRHKKALYTTRTIHDNDEGWAAVELLRTLDGIMQPVARVVFWDAEGQFALEMKAPELPLDIVEELVDEARKTIKVR